MIALRLLSFLIAAGHQDSPPKSYDLTWRPRAGLVTKYQLHLELQLEATHVDIAADLKMTVRKRAPDGSYEIETATTHVRVTTDQTTQTLPDEAPTVDHYDSAGKRLSTANEDSDNPFTQVIGPATDFVAPPAKVKAGDKWGRDLPGDPAKGRPSARVDYRLIGPVKSVSGECLRVKYAFAETAGPLRAKGDGYFLLDPRDSSVLQFESTLKNVRISPDVPPGTVVISLRRALPIG